MAASCRFFSASKIAYSALLTCRRPVSQHLLVRPLSVSAVRLNIDDQFNSAKTALNNLSEDPGNDVKLKIYALFKQATEGKNSKPKPGVLDFVGRAKWEAWAGLGEISMDDAKQQYISTVNQLVEEEGGATVHDDNGSPDHTYKELLISNADGHFSITLNRPKKKNAINFQMYEEWGMALDEAAHDSSVKFVTVTGAGDMYCSGNDLGNFANIPPEGIAHMAEEGGRIMTKYVSKFIDFPKPLIGLINGPAVGISVTTLGLFDAVYAVETATFHTPFTALGQSPEACSTLTFPKIMGPAKASEMLLFNRKLSAQEACDAGLITRVYPNDQFKTETDRIVSQLTKLPPNSLRLSKTVIRDVDRAELHAANQREAEVLVQRWQSPECMKAIMDFFSK